MTFSWKNVLDRKNLRCKGLEIDEGVCDMFENQPEAVVERLRRVVRNEIKEVMVVGQFKC